MTARDSARQWREVVAMTKHMLHCAAEGEWSALTELSGKRDRLLKALFSTLPKEMRDERMAAGVRELLVLDQQVRKLVLQAQQEAASVLRGISQGRKAQHVYQQRW